ncbi:MAG: PH domain-containing protein, partial [Thermoguttaceae bacterium]|nr:PH domain-containing protein [Thermoguttaceae bacterium]
KIAIWDIAQVNVTRNIWQRLLGVGTIELRIRDHGLTGDSSDPSLEGIDSDSSTADNILFLPGIKDPENVKDLINNYRLFVRRRMGRRFLNKITQ